MTAGAVLSGAYFGDKLSPLSDTTNLAPAMAGGELFAHIKYMLWTTIPTISTTLIVFIIIGLSLDTSGEADVATILTAIDASFNINGWLFLVPVIVVALIVKKTPPLAALLIGTLLGALFALIFQPQVVAGITNAPSLTFESGYKGILKAITVSTDVPTENPVLSDLFSAKGMSGMLVLFGLSYAHGIRRDNGWHRGPCTYHQILTGPGKIHFWSFLQYRHQLYCLERYGLRPIFGDRGSGKNVLQSL